MLTKGKVTLTGSGLEDDKESASISNIVVSRSINKSISKVSTPLVEQQLSNVNQIALQQFIQQLQLKAYSASTIPTYRTEFLQLLKLLKSKPVNELNCLTNLEFYNERPTSPYSIHPIDFDNFNETIDGESLKSEAKFWLVRGQQISLSHNKQDYVKAGIELKEYEPNEISAEEVGRLVVSQNRDLFRATDNELYKSIPTDLKKILVLDEWYHKDFQLQISPTMTDEHLRQTYEFNRNLTGLGDMTFESFAQSLRQQEILSDDWNREIWENNRPSSYETWQLIAKVIVTNDPKQYKPTLEPNTHWKNWPDSGSM